MKHLVNRTDVWGRYLARKYRKGPVGRNNAITAPFRDERGKVFLNESSLEKHYRTKSPGGVLGLHSSSADYTSRWFAIDVDLHDDLDLSISPEGNFAAAHEWWSSLQSMGFDPLLIDSNGAGGYHLLVVFAEPMSTKSVHAFTDRFVADFERRGLDMRRDIFPGKSESGHYGNWLRLPGRHHTREHYTRVWNDEPWAEDKWLIGGDAVDRILQVQPAPFELMNKHGIVRARKTVCLDFDGVIHSYRSGWFGESVIPDPPIHGVDKAIARLREWYDVVIHSSRCRTEEGREAIREWCAKHNIEVDDVCEHKPPAIVYVDDRGIPFRGDWDQMIADIHSFRK